MQNPLKRLYHIDSIISILLIGLSIWIYWYASFLINENTNPIAAHTFPRTLAVMFAGMSSVLLVKSFCSKEQTQSSTNHRIAGFSPNVFVVVILASLVVYAVLLPITGFIITSIAAMLIWLWLMGVRHYGLLIGFSIGVVFAVFGLFQIILKVPLP